MLPPHQGRRRLDQVTAWFSAVDPGAIRRRQGAVVAAATLSTWVTLRVLTQTVHGSQLPAVVLFGAVTSTVGSLAVADPRRHDRIVTMTGACITSMATVSMVAVLVDHAVVRYLLLLVSMFASFTLRRWGLRPGELALVATVTTYFASSGSVDTGHLGWFLVALGAGFGWQAIWQFLVIPYDPLKAVEMATRAFYRRAGEMVEQIRLEVQRAARPGPVPDAAPHRVARCLDRVSTTRRVIESQLAGALTPGGWAASNIEHLQVALYTSEQGLGMMAGSISDTSWLDGADPRLTTALDDALASLAVTLDDAASPASCGELGARAAALRGVVAEQIRLDHSAPSPSPLAFAVDLARGAQLLARSMTRSRELLIAASRSRTQVDSDPRPPPAAAPGSAAQHRPLRRLHPTTALGVQAIVATVAAALIATVVGVHHVNWTFWNAFLVIAGSAGESLRRMLGRVVGTTAGAVVGVGAALVLPERLTVVVLIATVGVFMAIYESRVSYPLMIFWLNAAFVVVFAQGGADEFDLLRQRPLTAAIGGLVSVVVSRTVLPVRVTDRFRQLLRRYLDSVEVASAAWIAAFAAPERRPEAETESARAAAVRQTLQHAIDASAYEANPFPRAQFAFAARAVPVAAIDEALRAVARAAPEAGDDPVTQMDAVTLIGDHIRRDLATVRSALDGRPTAASQPTPTATGGARTTGPIDRLHGADRNGPTGDEQSSLLDATADGPVVALAALSRRINELATSLRSPTPQARRTPATA